MPPIVVIIVDAKGTSSLKLLSDQFGIFKFKIKITITKTLYNINKIVTSIKILSD